jgi:putative membrane protein insertion efficiency factor
VQPRAIVVKVINAYRRFVSPLLPPSCRFSPSCSRYTLLAIEKHGVLKGSLMGVWRILRCNPFSKGGFDPVR